MKVFSWYKFIKPQYYNKELSTKYCKVVDIPTLEKEFNFNHNKKNDKLDRLIKTFDGWEYLYERALGKSCNVTLYYEFIGICLYTGLYDIDKQMKLNTFKVGTNELVFDVFPYFGDEKYFFDTYKKLLKYCKQS